MPLREAISRASEGDDSRARALSLAAAIADVVDVFFGVDVSPVAVEVVAEDSASSLAPSMSEVVVVSAMASFS